MQNKERFSSVYQEKMMQQLVKKMRLRLLLCQAEVLPICKSCLLSRCH